MTDNLNFNAIPHKVVATGSQTIWLDTVLIWLAASILPMYLMGWRFELSGLIARPADAAALILIGLTFFYMPNVGRAYLRPHSLMLAGVCVYILIQGAYLDNMPASIKEALQLAVASATIIVIGLYLARNPLAFLNAFLTFCILSLVYTIVFHFIIGQYTRYKFNYEGRYLFGLTSLLLLLYARREGWKFRWSALFMISLAPLVASMERKGLFGVAVIGALLVQVSALRRAGLDPKIYVLLAGLTVAALVVALAPGLHIEVMQTIRDNYFLDEGSALWISNMHRESLLINGFDVLSRNWLWGTGADSIRPQLLAYYADHRLANRSTHNFYLDTLIKYGIVGATPYFLAIAWGIKSSLTSAEDKLSASMLIGYLLFVVAFISEGIAVTLLALICMICGPLFNKPKT